MRGLLISRVCLVIVFVRYLQGSRLRVDDGLPRIIHHPADVMVQVGNPATLSCRAEGNPKPSIQWLRNGVPLELQSTVGQSGPIILPEGSLFFLRVAPGRGSQAHEAVYTCVARSSLGTATSRNATLRIAALRDEFRMHPGDTEVAQGEMAVMNCSSPLGYPEPNITWKKDGVLINTSDEHYTELSGKLIIAPARREDSGVYVCVASNIVAVRESRAARLTVLEKPVVLREPQDVSVRLGESAQFHCQAQGDPMPTVDWSRDQGPLPNGRYLVNPDHSLQIHYVTLQDAGSYTCTAANAVGVATASAQLFVEDGTSSRQRDLHRELSALRVTLENVTVLRTATNLSQVIWKLQSAPPQLLYLEGFEVLYRSILPATSDWAAQRVSRPALQASAGPLKRGYKYEFKVRPYGGDLYGRESNTRHLRVPETVPGAPPQGVSITVPADRNDTAYLSWEPPPHEAHNGIIQGYQVWCADEEEHHFLNWTVNSGTHSLEISPLKPGRQYSLRVAAVNGAGVGAQSSPYKLLIESREAIAPYQKSALSLSDVLAIMREPVFIGTVGALLWCLLMITAACLYRKHVRPTDLGGGQHKTAGLYQLTNEDLIIKHRMAAPDSPWISGAWKPASISETSHSLWTQSQDTAGLRTSTLPVTARQEPGASESAVPIVQDNRGVYGTFYVDLTAKGLKTFNSPARCPKMPHGSTQPQSPETIRITQPVAKAPVTRAGPVVPWKRALPAQPIMGVRKESWEKNCKRELHAVKSAPLRPVHQQSLVVRTAPNSQAHMHSQRPGGVSEWPKPFSSPKILHYSASLHLVDVMASPPPLPVDDSLSVSSEEGSSRSTKLTVDTASLQSVCTASVLQGQDTMATGCPSQRSASYSQLSTASFCLSTEEQQHAGQQCVELSPEHSSAHRALSETSPSLSRPFSPTHTFGYICGPFDREMGDLDDEQESRPMGLRRVALRSTPSSCHSEWEGSLWNGWGSVSEGNVPSARTSIISSSDGSFMNDANFARVLAMTGEPMSGSLSDFSPPASPLSMLLPPRDCFREVDAQRGWDWSTAWVEEMEAQLRASRQAREPAASSRHGRTEPWGEIPNSRPSVQLRTSRR
ncbi:roundabout homolog 4 isoform X2 [Brachyhypopomus gauderio]|uniref:roundabout homolog 4 isoform X2 n=1 Tax=Brachyhypopomus gauderio TaxID=698409 RepID=UPI004043399A